VTFLKNKDTHHRCFLACEGYSCIIKWLAERHDWSAGETLQGAVSEGHEYGVRCLLGWGVLGESVSNGMSKVLHMADEKRYYGIVELILRYGFEAEEEAACDALCGTVLCSNPKSLHCAASKAMIPPVQQWISPDWNRPVQSRSSPRNVWTGIGPIPDADRLDWAWSGPIPHGVQG